MDDRRFQGKISKTQDGIPRGEPPAEMSILNGLEVEYAMAEDMAVIEAIDEEVAKVQLDMSEDSTKLVPNQIRTQKRTPGLTAKDQLAYLLSQTHPNLEKMALPFFLTTTVFNGTTMELSTRYWTWWCSGAQAYVFESGWMGDDSRSLRETTAGQLEFTQEACRPRHFRPIPTDLYGD